MKKLFVLFVSGVLSLTATAQRSALIGTWQQLDANGNATTNVKIFMPDGKLLGECFNNDFTASSVWFMSNYKVLNDSTYADHAFYHSNPFYQRDYLFTFHKENDSVLVSQYIDFRPDGVGVILKEYWKKMDRALPVFTDAEWDALHQKSLVEFDRLPKEGQTLEQYAEELKQKALKGKTIESIFEPLLNRAELDTTNLEWQKDAFSAFITLRKSPAVAEKLANRIIRLTEAAAPSPTDTTVTEIYRYKAVMYANRGANDLASALKTMEQLVALEDRAGVPTRDYAFDICNLALTYFTLGNFDNCYKYAAKAVDIYGQLPDATNEEKANAYFLKVKGLANTNHLREAIDLALDKVVPLYTNEQGVLNEIVPIEVYPVVAGCYEFLHKADPKDKSVTKEFQQFMSDKLLCALFQATDKELNLYGEYVILEKDGWTMENPVIAEAPSKHIVLLKDDEIIEIDLKEDQDFNALPVFRPVGVAKKKDIIKRWKAYKKGKKVKK